MAQRSLTRPWATLYLLHGSTEEHTRWMRWTSIERYARGWPLAVVMPYGGNGWYTNAVNDGERYEDHLLKDVVGLVERTFPVRAERGGRAIGGVSMGAYGAVKLGLKLHDTFASVHSHSGALAVVRAEPGGNPQLPPDIRRVFGDKAFGGPDDPFAILGAWTTAWRARANRSSESPPGEFDKKLRKQAQRQAWPSRDLWGWVLTRQSGDFVAGSTGTPNDWFEIRLGS